MKKRIWLAALCLLVTHGTQHAMEETKPIITKIIIRESTPSQRVKRILLYSVGISCGTLYLDKHFFSGRFLCSPLMHRLFPELYQTIRDNNARLKALEQQADRIETRVDATGSLLAAVAQQLEETHADVQGNGQKLDQQKQTLARIENNGQDHGDQLREIRGSLARLESGNNALLRGQGEYLQLLTQPLTIDYPGALAPTPPNSPRSPAAQR